MSPIDSYHLSLVPTTSGSPICLLKFPLSYCSWLPIVFPGTTWLVSHYAIIDSLPCSHIKQMPCPHQEKRTNSSTNSPSSTACNEIYLATSCATFAIIFISMKAQTMSVSKSLARRTSENVLLNAPGDGRNVFHWRWELRLHLHTKFCTTFTFFTFSLLWGDTIMAQDLELARRPYPSRKSNFILHGRLARFFPLTCRSVVSQQVFAYGYSRWCIWRVTSQL